AQGSIRAAEKLSSKLEEGVREGRGVSVRGEILRAHGESLFYRGKLRESIALFNEAISTKRSNVARSEGMSFWQDSHIASLAHRAAALWILGDAGRAIEDHDQYMNEASQSRSPLVRGYALAFSGALGQFLRDPKRVRRAVDDLATLV